MKNEYQVQKYKISYVKEDTFTFDKKIRSRLDVKDFCQSELEDCPLERFIVLAMNSNNKIIGIDISQGTTNHCSVYIKNVFIFLLSAGATSFILAHNHPGESNIPSETDWVLTHKMRKAGKIMDCDLLDHVIIAGNTTISMRELSRWK
jgi:DNA repair protein RadC